MANNNLDSNSALNGWEALKWGGLALAGLAGYGMIRKNISKLPASVGQHTGAAKAAMGRATTAGVMDTGGLRNATSRLMGAANWNTNTFGEMASSTASRLGGAGKAFGKWISGDGLTGWDRGLAVGARAGAVGAAGFAGSYINPLSDDKGTLSGTLKTLGLAAGGVAAFGAARNLGRWRKFNASRIASGGAGARQVPLPGGSGSPPVIPSMKPRGGPNRPFGSGSRGYNPGAAGRQVSGSMPMMGPVPSPALRPGGPGWGNRRSVAPSTRDAAWANISQPYG